MKKQVVAVLCLCSVIFLALLGYNVSRVKITDVELELPETVTVGEQVPCNYTISADMMSTTYTRTFIPKINEDDPEDTGSTISDIQTRYVEGQMEGWQVTWASSNEAVAIVSESGVITAVGGGTTQITITVVDGRGTEIQKEATLTVGVPLESIIAPEAVQVEVGGTLTLQVELQPENATNKGLIYTSADESIATVNENGVITGVAGGHTIITITSADEHIQGTPPSTQVQVEVGIAPAQVSLNRQEASIRTGGAIQLNATVAPANVTLPYELAWTTSNAGVATVSATGRVTGVDVGTANITVTIAGTQLSATCTVTVTAAPANSTPTPPTGGGGNAGGSMQDLLNLVNAARAQAGVPALTLSAELNSAASVRAGELVASFSHTRPDGTEWHTVSGSARGENIAYGYGSTQAVFDGWMGSDGHRANILNPNYTIMGGGCYSSSGTYYWCQLFG